MSELEWSMAARLIREAMERGEFDNLKGAGKPLNLGRSDNPNWWIQQKIESEQLEGIVEAGAPGVLALRREASRFPESLLEEPSEQAVRERIADYNRRVREDRLRPQLSLPVPIIAPTVDEDAMVAKWHRLRAERGRR